MARAEILIEDAEDGRGAHVRFLFPDGFKADSAAHQLAGILQRRLDAMVTGGELQAVSERETFGDVSGLDTVTADPVQAAAERE